jgi:hypothetical protein
MTTTASGTPKRNSQRRERRIEGTEAVLFTEHRIVPASATCPCGAIVTVADTSCWRCGEVLERGVVG